MIRGDGREGIRADSYRFVVSVSIRGRIRREGGGTCIKTRKPQLYAEASVIRVATTYFPTIRMQYHRRCGA